LEGRTKDISLQGCGIRFDQPVPELSGALSLHFKDIGSTEAREVRRAEGRDVFFELVNVPEATENALFARLFLDPAHHTRKLLGAGSLYVGCAKRFFAKIH
jgi:hypothetical protein